MEIWKSIIGFEGKYEISNFCRLKRLPNKIGKGFPKKERILLPHKDAYGYGRFSLADSNGISKHYKAHQLIAKAFIPNPFNKRYINHKNGIKDDNRIDNLEWCTLGENNKHAHATKIKNLKGCKNGRALLNDEQVMEIYLAHQTQKELGKKYGVSQATISVIKRDKNWNHVTQNCH